MKRVVVRKDVYVDSVVLMLMSRELQNRPDVDSATVAMGTPMNVALLRDQGFPESELASVTPADLVMALECPKEQDFDTVFALARELLAGKRPQRDRQSEEEPPRSIGDALRLIPDANIAVISVPGPYAAREARKAINRGLHVMLFSDNVSLEDEIELKRLATEKGLLVMGPDCGTAIIGRKPLCFANVVAPGPVGIVAASGTGLQEVSCLVDRFGSGVSQAIGTGGRDLKNKAVGGASMLMAIAALGADEQTKVIVVVSKPPAGDVVEKVLDALARTGKPSVVHFIGAEPGAFPQSPSIRWAGNLEETSRIAVSLAGIPMPPREHHDAWPFDMDHETIDALVKREFSGMGPRQKHLRGYYTGGTLADEAWLGLRDVPGGVWSNNQTDPAFVLADSHVSFANTVVDLGDDAFTVGRPHPMIDPSIRTDRIDAEREDPSVAVMLVDCVLGYGSHDNPAGAMIPSLKAAKEAARKRGEYLSIIASVTGTAKDPQRMGSQIAKMEEAGIIVMPSNFQAVKLARRILSRELGPGAAAPKNTAFAVTEKKKKAVGPTPDVSGILDLFAGGPKAVNLGLESFAANLASSGAPVIHLDWRPPAGGDVEIIAALDRIERIKDIDIEAANREAVGRVLKGKPMLTGIGTARDVVPGMRDNLVLHAGPPVTWERMCGPMRGAVMGALVYEGLASDSEDARHLASSGEISFEPCHHHSAVGPMAGIMTASMPVWIIRNQTYGNTAYATLNEGLGKVLRYGAYSQEVIDRLRWMERELAPILNKAIERHGPIDMRSLVVQALQMGDEGHNRNRAGTSLIIRELAPHLVMLDEDREAIARVLEFMHGNDHFFLNLSMPAAKCILDAASDIKGSTLITAMARNGTEFGIRISGLKDRWFTGPASMVEGLYLPGFSAEDAAPDIGDSVITETSGIGGFAMAASPAIVKFVGGTPADAIAYTKRMYSITMAENEEYRIPILDFRGTPTGIDVRLVVEKGILPVINTGIAHKDPGVGMVGAGLVKPPENCFRDAVLAFADAYAAV